MSDNNVSEESIAHLKSKCKFFKYRSQLYSAIFSTVLSAVLILIIWMFSFLSVQGIIAIDKEIHLSQFTTAMAQIFINLAPIIMYAYIGCNWVFSTCKIFRDELKVGFECIEMFAKGGFKELKKNDEPK